MEKLKKSEMYEEDEDFPKDEEVSTSIMWVRFGNIYQAYDTQVLEYVKKTNSKEMTLIPYQTKPSITLPCRSSGTSWVRALK